MDNNEKMKLRKRYTIWKSLKKKGDVTELATSTGVSTVTISAAINEGRGGEDVLTAVNEFYKKREGIFKQPVKTPA